MAAHSSVLTWRITRTEEAAVMGSERVRCASTTKQERYRTDAPSRHWYERQTSEEGGPLPDGRVSQNLRGLWKSS